VVVVGTTGESPTLKKEEEVRLFREVKEAVGDRGSVVAGTGSNSTYEAVETTMKAESVGVDGCLLVVPYYNKPTQEGLYRHFKAIAGSTTLPCIPYNVPSRTITNLTAETVVRLSQIENIIGVKEASGDLAQIAEIITKTSGKDKEFLVWSGNDSDTFHLMALGGYGVISVASHLVGPHIKKMIEMTVQGKLEEARHLHLILMPLFKSLFVVSNPILVKYAVNQIGFPVGKPRLPLVEPDEKTAQMLDEKLKEFSGLIHLEEPVAAARRRR